MNGRAGNDPVVSRGDKAPGVIIFRIAFHQYRFIPECGSLFKTVFDQFLEICCRWYSVRTATGVRISSSLSYFPSIWNRENIA